MLSESNDYLGVQVMAMAYFGLRPAESVSLDYQESFCTEGGHPYIHVVNGSKAESEKNPNENR